MASQWEYIKWIPGTPFMVDGFKFQSPRCRHYFLTHYHADHTIGLNSGFSAGTVYCSHVTSNLLIRDMRVNPSCIRALPLNTELLIEGIRVTLIDANHCPGAVLLLFKTPPPKGSTFSQEVILHTGDMRWNPRMGKHPALAKQRIDQLFLDTTYASPKHTFPSQERAICKIVELMTKHMSQEPQTLFVMGSYRIGKERAYLGAAKAMGFRCHVNADKLRVLRLLGLPEADLKLVTKDRNAARIHVSFMGKVFLPEALRERIAGTQWTHVVAFRPTGWSFQKRGVNVRKEGNITIYGIPYSEHSSYDELRDCVRTLRPRKLIPTVNAANAASAKALVDRFAELMDLTKDRGRLDFFLKKAKTVPAASLDAAADSHSLSAPALSRAGTAPAASTAEACEMLGSARVGSTGEAPEEAPADPAAENEEALYWQQHGEIEEEDCGFEGLEGSDVAADLDHSTVSWCKAAEHDTEQDDWSKPADCFSTEQAFLALAADAVKAEPGAPDLASNRAPCKEEGSAAAWPHARVKQEPLEPRSSAAEHSRRLRPDPAASLRRFSYTGSPVKHEDPPDLKPASHAGRDDSRDHRVLVHLGLDSPKAQLPSSMAAASSGIPLARAAGASACNSAPVQSRRWTGIVDAAEHGCDQHAGSAVSAALAGSVHAEQQTGGCVKQEELRQHACQTGTAAHAQSSRADESPALLGAFLPHASSPDSWATASQGLQDRQREQKTPPRLSISSPCAEHGLSNAHGISKDLPVTDICSPEPAVPKQPVLDSLAGVKGEHGSAGTTCESVGMRSPGGSEHIDLAAIDLAEQQRLLRLIAARKALQDDIQASRACMQALSAQPLPESSLKKRGRTAAQPHRTPAPVRTLTKRRQLGIGAFLFSQQRSDGM